jgi:hypothetical protein
MQAKTLSQTLKDWGERAELTSHAAEPPGASYLADFSVFGTSFAPRSMDANQPRVRITERTNPMNQPSPTEPALAATGETP